MRLVASCGTRLISTFCLVCSFTCYKLKLYKECHLLKLRVLGGRRIHSSYNSVSEKEEKRAAFLCYKSNKLFQEYMHTNLNICKLHGFFCGSVKTKMANKMQIENKIIFHSSFYSRKYIRKRKRQSFVLFLVNPSTVVIRNCFHFETK